MIGETRPANKRVNPKRWYSTSDLCDLLGVTRQTIHTYRKHGLLRGARQYRDRGPWYYPGRSVNAFLRRSRTL